MAKNLIEKTAGQITVDTAEDEGTCFTIELPLAEESYSATDSSENPVSETRTAEEE